MQVGLKGNADVNNVSLAGVPVFLLACEQAPECATMCLRMLESGADPNATNEVRRAVGCGWAGVGWGGRGLDA